MSATWGWSTHHAAGRQWLQPGVHLPPVTHPQLFGNTTLSAQREVPWQYTSGYHWFQFYIPVRPLPHPLTPMYRWSTHRATQEWYSPGYRWLQMGVPVSGAPVIHPQLYGNMIFAAQREMPQQVRAVPMNAISASGSEEYDPWSSVFDSSFGSG